MHASVVMRNFVLLSQDTAFLQNLLLWFQHDNGDASDCVMLNLISTLIHQQGVSAKLRSLGLPALLDDLCARPSPDLKRSANKTLTALIQSDSACFSQQTGQQAQHLSPHDPQSRCQSNSPPFQSNAHSHRSQEMDTSWLHKPPKLITHARQSSHAFGSQQGKSSLTACHCYVDGSQKPCFFSIKQMLTHARECHADCHLVDFRGSIAISRAFFAEDSWQRS